MIYIKNICIYYIYYNGQCKQTEEQARKNIFYSSFFFFNLFLLFIQTLTKKILARIFLLSFYGCPCTPAHARVHSHTHTHFCSCTGHDSLQMLGRHSAGESCWFSKAGRMGGEINAGLLFQQSRGAAGTRRCHSVTQGQHLITNKQPMPGLRIALKQLLTPRL